MKKILWIIGGVALLAIAAGGGFEGGIAYQRNQANQIRNQFFQSRGSNASNGGQPASGSSSNPGFSRFGGGVTGSIKSIQGNQLELSTATGVTTVNLTANTQIEKSISGTPADLQPGEQLVVRGQSDSNGNVTADQIQIVGSTAAQGAPAPQESAP